MIRVIAVRTSDHGREVTSQKGNKYQVPLYQVRAYNPIRRKNDGVETFRAAEFIGPRFRNKKKAVAFAKELCENSPEEYVYVQRVMHGVRRDNIPVIFQTLLTFFEESEDI